MSSDSDVVAFYRELGKIVSTRRKSRKFNQTQLAKAIGVSRTSVTNLERGRQRIPAHYLLHIAELLDCELSDLLPVRKSLSESRDTPHLKMVGSPTPSVRAVVSRYATESEESA